MQHLLRYKIINAIIVLIFFCPLLSIAQLRETINLPDHDDKPYHFGINIGINRSHFNFLLSPTFLTQDSVTNVESINSTGLNLALLWDKKLGEHFSLRTYPLDLTFTEKDFQYALKYPNPFLGESAVTIKKLQSISLTLPIQIKFTSDRINNFKVYMLTGVKGEYDLASNANAINAQNLIKLNRFDYGIDAAVGFHFYYPYFVLTPELKFGWGLNDLHHRDPTLKFSNVIDKINSRTITLSITVE